jgi:K(+)-stimulated pyrophosphate-energized sodium pump
MMTLLFVLAVSLAALAVAGLFTAQVMKKDAGTPEMRRISDAIRQGAEAFLRRQNSTITVLSLVVALIIFVMYFLAKKSTAEAFATSLSFLAGAFFSGLAGFIGMFVAVRSNIRTASAARRSLGEALVTALRGGAVSGITVVALSLIGVGGLFVLFGGLASPQTVPLKIIGFGFGASFTALFAQLGGGIYTKAADVGADLVGKIEAGIPEDDPRNPAVIADLVGDNVGDCAGRGADLFESTAAENVGAMILGAALFPVFGVAGILFPLVARAGGLLAAIVGVLSVKLKNEDEDPMAALNRGYLVTSLGAGLAFYLCVRWFLKDNLWLFAAGLIGILVSYAFVWITQYYTEYRYRPVKEIAKASQTGDATLIITGLSVGMESVAAPVLLITAALIASYRCGVMALAGVPDLPPMSAGLYGTAVATMGMLSTCAYVLSMDTFGPITDNAGGIVEMSHQPDQVRRVTDRLDSVGNTTKALTKGYAVGSAALAAFLLFSAYMDEITHLTGRPFHSVDLAKVEVFAGAILGGMLVLLFSSLAIRAVGKAAYYVINDVRNQFAENPEILQAGKGADYARCVDIVTKGALKEMVLPGVLAIAFPVVVGVVFRVFGVGAEAVAGFLMVGTITGILMALFMNNGGGAWDNAKKYIETGAFGGKGSPSHQAAVVGDTVGDPLKDTAGPSLHVLIKLLSTITLVFAPLFI